LHSEASNYDLLSSTTTHLDNTRSSSEDSWKKLEENVMPLISKKKKKMLCYELIHWLSIYISYSEMEWCLIKQVLHKYLVDFFNISI
jgi:hypothetical protein